MKPVQPRPSPTRSVSSLPKGSPAVPLRALRLAPLAAGLLLSVVACSDSGDDSSASSGTASSASTGLGGSGGGETGVGGGGGAGGSAGSGYVPPEPEPALCDHVGKHGAVTIHSVEVMDDLTAPNNTIWTYSPVHLKVKASAAGIAPGTKVNIPIQFGVIPPVSATTPVGEVAKFVCPLEAVTLKGVTGDVQEFDFKYVVMDDSCFQAGSPFVDKLKFTPSGDAGWYTVNLSLQVDPFCSDTPEPPILFVNELAGQAPNKSCSSSQGAGCVWNLPVYFPQPGEFDIRLDETRSNSKVAFVATEPTDAPVLFTPATSTLIAYGVPPKVDGPATLPGGNVLLVEYFVKAKGESGRGDPILAAAGDLAPAASIALNQFEMSKPTDHEHLLFLPEATRAKAVSGVWSKADSLTVTACVRLKGTDIDPAECMSFDVAADRGKAPTALNEGEGQASGMKPVATCYGPYFGLDHDWPSLLGSQVQVQSDAWAFYYGDATGTHSEAGLLVDVSALNNYLGIRVVDALFKADSDTAKTAKAVSRVEVLGQTIVKKEYESQLPSANWGKTFSSPCASAQIPVGPVFVTVEGCPKGSLSFQASGQFLAKSGPGPKPYDTATAYGSLTANIVPTLSAALAAKAGAAAGVGKIASIQVGLSGELTLLNSSWPSTATLEWGKSSNGIVDATIVGNTKLTMTTLSGIVNAYVKVTGLFVTLYQKTVPLWSYAGTTSSPVNYSVPKTSFCIQ